jgi:hypothetical protein
MPLIEAWAAILVQNGSTNHGSQRRFFQSQRSTMNPSFRPLGSGLIDQSQKMTVAAMQMADMKVWAHRS